MLSSKLALKWQNLSPQINLTFNMKVKLSPKPPNAAFLNFLTSLMIEESVPIGHQNCSLELQFAIMQESDFLTHSEKTLENNI